jgi:hypothetical protein
VLLAAVCIELREANRDGKLQILQKWLAVAVCLGFGAFFLIVDSPQDVSQHRPHMTTIFVGVVVFAGAVGLQVLARKHRVLKSRAAVLTGAGLVLMTAFGAQAGLLRGVVVNRMEQLDFVRTELMAKDPAAYSRILVVPPSWRGCVTEPCDAWMGHIIDKEGVISREHIYRYALVTLGASLEGKTVEIVTQKPVAVPSGAVVVDWRKYAAARKRHLQWLTQGRPFDAPTAQ